VKRTVITLVLFLPLTACACPWVPACGEPDTRVLETACAKSLYKYYSDINSAISLSPVEQAWLKQEMDDAKNTQRYMKALQSTEYAKQHVRQMTSFVLEYLDAMIKSENKEPAWWVLLLMTINHGRYYDSLEKLIKRGALDPGVIGLKAAEKDEAKDFLTAGCRRLTRNLLREIILPAVQKP